MTIRDPAVPSGEYQEFYLTQRPREHFRTSALVGGPFARAIFAMAVRVDAALEHPAKFVVVDVGAGEGELLTDLLGLARGTGLGRRLELIGVDLRERPSDLPDEIRWRRQTAQSFDESFDGLMLCTELFDDVPAGGGELALQLARRVRNGQMLIVDYAQSGEDRVEPTAYLRGRQVTAAGNDRNVTKHVDFQELSRVLSPLGSIVRMKQAQAIEQLAPAANDLTGIAALEHRSKLHVLTDPSGLGGHEWLWLTLGSATN